MGLRDRPAARLVSIAKKARAPRSKSGFRCAKGVSETEAASDRGAECGGCQADSGRRGRRRCARHARRVPEDAGLYGHRSRRTDRAGLERLQDDNPDLLMVDFAMPGMNGIDVIAQARKMRDDLPVILATGYADVDIFGLARSASRSCASLFNSTIWRERSGSASVHKSLDLLFFCESDCL